MKKHREKERKKIKTHTINNHHLNNKHNLRYKNIFYPFYFQTNNQPSSTTKMYLGPHLILKVLFGKWGKGTLPYVYKFLGRTVPTTHHNFCMAFFFLFLTHTKKHIISMTWSMTWNLYSNVLTYLKSFILQDAPRSPLNISKIEMFNNYD